jgi:hypothetical protein
MPIYEDVLPYERMKQLERNHVCECGGVLTVAWDGSKGMYMLRCGNNIEHNAINKVDLSADYAELKSKLGWRDKRLAAQVGTRKFRS